MALFAQHKDGRFGVGDTVRVIQKIKEDEKTRTQTFEGIVIGIKGRAENKSFTVRRVGTAQIGIEKIFPLFSPTIEKIEVVRAGTKGTRRAKLYFVRNKARREVEKLYSRTKKKSQPEALSKKKIGKKVKAAKKSAPVKPRSKTSKKA